MLELASETSDAWVRQALAGLDIVLLDHAHAERKAASTAINLMFRYQDQAEMMVPLSALAREELDHFEQVVGVLAARGIAFGPLAPSPYAARLHAAIRPEEPLRRLDTLLVCALIEARSCERMKRLADALPDAALAEFYRSLLACEARHFHGYTSLAYAAFPREVVRARLRELAEHEAAVLREPSPAIRLHS
jgi:tRNA-(ms[2]io[6]A)-hydroxylase